MLGLLLERGYSIARLDRLLEGNVAILVGLGPRIDLLVPQGLVVEVDVLAGVHIPRSVDLVGRELAFLLSLLFTAWMRVA